MENNTPVNMGNGPHCDNGEGVAATPLLYPLIANVRRGGMDRMVDLRQCGESFSLSLLGEGRGEGERDSQLHHHGWKRLPLLPDS